MQELNYPFDPSYIIKKRKSIKRELLADGSARIKKKIAVFGGSTTNEIINTLELFLLNAGIEAEFYESEYAQYEQDAVFPSEELICFKPDIVFVHTTNRNIRNLPEVTDSKEIVDEKLKAEFARFENIWNSIRDKFHCPIIQNNFEMPFYRLMGNKDCSDYRGRTNFISRLNQAFYDFAEKTEGFYINDINYLSADYGLKEWSNPSFWNMYKYAMCFEAIPSLAFSVSNIIKSIFGKNKKALALDLDNTLWGGVVGDDGVDGIEIGQENGVSQSYYEFQSYIKQLKSLGIILTVCSKNDHENAIAGLNHPEGVLKPDDFIIIKANWENKDRNIAETAAELNILPEAIVFVDDNPAEREIVKAQLKGVQAPVMDSVENYITKIDRSGFFEVTTFNEDDLKRKPGSSIMPGKVNPVIPEVVNQVAFKVIGNDLTVTLAAEAGQLELNVMEPIIVHSLFESIDLLSNGMNTLRDRCVAGITANEEVCRKLVYNSIGLVTALNPYLGYETSTELAKTALKTGKGIYELVLEKKLMSQEELDNVLSPENMIKLRKFYHK